MDLSLIGRRALITGSSEGLGAAIATMLAAEGATVALRAYMPGEGIVEQTWVPPAVTQVKQ